MTNPTGTRYRTYPTHTLDQALVVATAINDAMAGSPMNRLLLADALDIKPSSSNYRDLLSSSRKYGLTLGTEKADEVTLTELGRTVVGKGSSYRAALREAALHPALFKQFYQDYTNAKLPGAEMFAKILVSKYGVPEKNAAECAELLRTNGEQVGIVRSISGAPHVIFPTDGPGTEPQVEEDGTNDEETDRAKDQHDAAAEEATRESPNGHVAQLPGPAGGGATPKAIFLGHGRKTGPREKIERILSEFKIPFAVAVSEPNLGKPIPTKVRDTMLNCGSAILIFTKDQKLFIEDGDGSQKEIWRPSENVVHELGAASLLYEDKIVIFKERGINLPSNFSSIGYIEFDEDGIEAKSVDLLKELIGFGLVTIAPVA